MKPIAKQSNKKAGWTIVELLTVMSIITLLIGLLVPALNLAKKNARKVKQHAQFYSINTQMELFNNEWDGYPPSSEMDEVPVPYCGAMKLAEAMMGQDLLGFHPDSHFRADGTDGGPTPLYPDPAPLPGTPAYLAYLENLKSRKGPYLQPANANAYRLNDLYAGNTGPFGTNPFVLCDVYRSVRPQSGGKTGMPILYYRADTSRTQHNQANPDDPQNIYNYRDNHSLVELGVPSDQSIQHRLFTEPARFYELTWNDKVTATSRPYKTDSYILLSAGFDGQYGTDDDVFNFSAK
ncbi:MAG: pilus assembly FimT family protein [Planctomycetota bacterium]